MRDQMKMSHKAYRTRLLTTVSAAVLLVSAYGIGRAEAADQDGDHPPLVIEIGGQLSRLSSVHNDLSIPFYSLIADDGLESPLQLEKSPDYSIDEYGKMSFRPGGSDWSISLGVQYGKSSNSREKQQTVTPQAFQLSFGVPHTPKYGKFSHTEWESSEKHSIVDFQVGKDVGLGIFGERTASHVDFGVRFAQLVSKSKGYVNSDPTLQYPTHPIGYGAFFNTFNLHANVYTEQDQNEAQFRGVGPSVSWRGSANIAGNSDSAALGIDWDVSAAVLFGRQKSRGHHQTHLTACGAGWYYCFGYPFPAKSTGPYDVHDRSRNVTVPNVGGSIGLSFVSGDAKVSFGYRADLFMNAMDTGIDVTKKSNTFFHGPYASISIGIGD